MLQLDALTNNSAGDSMTVVQKVAFSLNGDTLYVFTRNKWNLATLMAWDISNGMLIAEKRDLALGGFWIVFKLVTVKAGVMLQTSWSTLELWNFKMSECIRSWADLGDILEVIRIAEERVACKVNSKVIILDTTMEGMVSTVTFRRYLVACNSKCHMITADDAELRMQCGDVVLWKIPFRASCLFQCDTFSPGEQYYVLAGRSTADKETALYVLDLVARTTLHKLCSVSDWVPHYLYWKFVSDFECVANLSDERRSYFCLRLFNVKSGDLLSEIATETKVYSLKACPRERLIAIGFEHCKGNFKVLQVKLPGDDDSRKKGKLFSD